jgi:hypothetical protein
MRLQDFCNIVGVLSGLLVLGSPAAANTTLNPVTIARASVSPIIDGILEEVWNEADSVTIFCQAVPREGAPISEPTKAYMLQDGWAFYVAFVCRTPGRKPDCQMGNRDSQEGDYVAVYLDTFHDRRTAYGFCVNAANVQADWILSADGRESNYSWDGVFYSNTEIDSSGYTVEIAIPWSSIRYDKGGDVWGFNLKREIPISGEEAYCTQVKQNEGLCVSEFRDMNEIHPTFAGYGIEIYPYTFYRTEKSYGEHDDKIQLAADINWKPASWLKLQSTFNPDFSQIEADPFSLNLSKYSLYFPEKRPFFTEESEFFQPSGGATAGMFKIFYSRQVGRKLSDGSEVPLLAGARLTGKKGPVEVGSLGVFTGKETYEGYFGPQTEPKAFFAADRVNFQIASNMTGGILYAGKYDSSISNQVISADGTYSTGSFQLTGQAARSWYDVQADWAFKSYLKYISRSLAVSGAATVVGDNFNLSEIGYVPWAGMRSYWLAAGPVFFPESGPMTYAYVSLTGSATRELGEVNYSYDMTGHAETALRNGWGMGADYTIGKYYELDHRYNPRSLGGFIQTDVTRRAWMMLSYSSSFGYNYYRDYFGRSDYISYYSSWRPAKRLSLYSNGTAWVERDPGGHVDEITYRIRPGIQYTLIQGMVVSLYEETPVTRSRGILSIRTGFSLSYNFLPKSWLYLAFNDYQYRDDQHEYHPLQRVFAAKVRHLFSF